LDLGSIQTNGDSNASKANGGGQREAVPIGASTLAALQLYAAILDDIREKAQAIVEWAEQSMREYGAITVQGEGGKDAAE